MTKKEQVLALLDRGLSEPEIAAHVGCHVAYVRVCRQRRGGQSVADKNYWPKKLAAEMRLYHSIPRPERLRIGRTVPNRKMAMEVRREARRRLKEMTP